MTQYTKTKVIKEFFAMTSKEIMTEYRALSSEDRLEIAQGAAQNLDLTQEACDFPLK